LEIVYFLRIRSNLFLIIPRAKACEPALTYPVQNGGNRAVFRYPLVEPAAATLGSGIAVTCYNEFRGVTQPAVWEFILPVNLFN
jgi:hypothetical protein